MSKRRFKDYENLGVGKLRYDIDSAQKVDSIALEDPLGVIGDVELLSDSYQLNSESGEPPFASVVVDVGERLFPTLVVTGEWDKAKE